MCNNLKKLWLIGAGPMGIEYAKVLNEINIAYDVIGRGRESAKHFEKIYNKRVHTGGINNWLKKKTENEPYGCIVAVGVEQLYSVTISLIEYGIKNILVEKPGGFYPDQIKQINKAALKNNSTIYIAYNRRFFASTIKAIEIIDNNGGALSFNFEFTEWIHKLEQLNIPQRIQENWFFVNSTHVIDLAFFIGGSPKDISTYVGNELTCCPKTHIFSGSGISEKGALFSYNANWCSAGRWCVEILTKSNRLIFSPLEQLQIIQKGSITSDYVEIDNKLDKQYKPGLFLQTQAFINNEKSNLCTIREHMKNLNFYERIFLGH